MKRTVLMLCMTAAVLALSVGNLMAVRRNASLILQGRQPFLSFLRGNSRVSARTQDSEEALKVMVAFLDAWQQGNAEDMASCSLPSWKAVRAEPAAEIARLAGNTRLTEYRLEGEVSDFETDAVHRMFSVRVLMRGTRTYHAFRLLPELLFEDDGWYVDPETFANGTTISLEDYMNSSAAVQEAM